MTSRSGADFALASAVASAVGLPAEPGIVVGGGVSVVGGVSGLIGSASQFVGDWLSSNPSASASGYLSGTLGYVE